MHGTADGGADEAVTQLVARTIAATKTTALIGERGARSRIGGFSLKPPFLFPLPAALVVLALAIYPIAYTLIISSRRYDLGLAKYAFVGTDNFTKALSSSQFLSAVLRTAGFTALSVVASVALGMVMAIVLNRDFRGARWARTAFLLPMVATPVATSLVWMMMFNPTLGILNYVLSIFGLPPLLWVANPTFVIPCLVLVDVWHSAPFAMIILLAGLRALPREPVESAMIDGATRFQIFRLVTLPMLKPVLVVVLLFRTIDALKAFDIIWVITAGGPGTSSETLYVYAYNQAFKYLDLGYGSAVIAIFALIVGGASIAWIRARERQWN